MKIQISGPTEVTGDNARYTVDLSELTPGSYTLVAGAWNDTSSILGHLNFTTKPIPTGPDASYYTQAPTLLSGYYVRHVVNDIAGIPHGEPQRDQAQTRGMRYQPRQFAAGIDLAYWDWDYQPADMRVVDPGPYAGLDFLAVRRYPPYNAYIYPDFLWIRLNRTARVGVIWVSPSRPSWLDDSWVRGADIAITQPWNGQGSISVSTYWKTLPAGEHWLGSNESKSDYPYALLFAEADGRPSAAPASPAGYEVPQPNRPAPAWLHPNRPKILGWDGNLYPTWHPQIDPVYWCYYGHEHGSCPWGHPVAKAALDAGVFKPAVGYVATKAGQINSQNYTTKGYKWFWYEKDGYLHVFVINFWTGREKITQRWAEYGYWIFSTTPGLAPQQALKAELHWLADTGPRLNASIGNNLYYHLADFPENLSIPMDDTTGRTRIPLSDHSGYETHQFTFPRELGFNGPMRAYNVDNPSQVCTPTQDAQGSWTCEGLAQRGFADWSDNRWFIKPDNDFPDGGVIVDASKALATGVFYTDPFGKVRRAMSDPDAVRQYLEPGFFLQDKDPWRWIQYHPWGGPWIPARPIVSGVPYVNFDQYRSLEGGLDLSN